jgi:hypothetical protein
MFLELRRRLINWMAGEDVIVIINTAMYDSALEANAKLFPSNCLFRRNKVVNFDAIMEAEVEQRVGLRKQGVRKSGRGFVLDPSLL